VWILYCQFSLYPVMVACTHGLKRSPLSSPNAGILPLEYIKGSIIGLYPIKAVQMALLPTPGSFCVRREPETPARNNVVFVISISTVSREVYLLKPALVL